MHVNRQIAGSMSATRDVMQHSGLNLVLVYFSSMHVLAYPVTLGLITLSTSNLAY